MTFWFGRYPCSVLVEPRTCPSILFEILDRVADWCGVYFFDRNIRHMATGTVRVVPTPKRVLASSNLTRAATTFFVHISAVERAGLGSLHEGQKISYELEKDGRSGKTAAGQLASAVKATGRRSEFGST